MEEDDGKGGSLPSMTVPTTTCASVEGSQQQTPVPMDEEEQVRQSSISMMLGLYILADVFASPITYYQVASASVIRPSTSASRGGMNDEEVEESVSRHVFDF